LINKKIVYNRVLRLWIKTNKKGGTMKFIERKFFLPLPAIIGIISVCIICGGCSDSEGEGGLKALMKKMPWAEEEKPPEKSEFDLLKEEYEGYKAQYAEKKQELKELQKTVKGGKRDNKVNGVTANYKCAKCGQNSMRPTKCFYCGSTGPWIVNKVRDDRDQDARLSNMRRIGELQKEMKVLKEKIVIVTEKAKAAKEEEEKSGKKKK
jgi:C-terminal processing protease CtpA/Prc